MQNCWQCTLETFHALHCFRYICSLITLQQMADCVSACVFPRQRTSAVVMAIKMSGSGSGASSALSPPSGRRGMTSQGSSCKCPSFLFSMQDHQNQMRMMIICVFSSCIYRSPIKSCKRSNGLLPNLKLSKLQDSSATIVS